MEKSIRYVIFYEGVWMAEWYWPQYLDEIPSEPFEIKSAYPREGLFRYIEPKMLLGFKNSPDLDKAIEEWEILREIKEERLCKES